MLNPPCHLGLPGAGVSDNDGGMKSSLSVILVGCLALVLVLVPRPSLAALPGAEALAGLILGEFDLNADSIVDAGEWQAGVEKGFDEMDANGDGSLSEAELDGLAGPISEGAGGIVADVLTGLIKRIVMTLDKNGDKLVSKAEYLAGCEKIFKMLDANQDGQLSKVELLDLPAKWLGSLLK